MPRLFCIPSFACWQAIKGFQLTSHSANSASKRDCPMTAGVSGAVDGKAFCFLPLPVSTGLPLHVNAFFELSTNRRDIWYGSDLAGAGKLRSDWNISLLEVSSVNRNLWKLWLCNAQPWEGLR